MKTKILNIFFDTHNMEEAVERGNELLESEGGKYIVTPNPEMCMIARKNLEFRNILNVADMVLPDGIGIVFASYLNKIKVKERVAGFDFINALLESHRKEKLRVYLLGGKKGVAEKAKKNIEKKYKDVEVVGCRDGYFNETEEIEIIKTIRKLKVDLLLVGLGMEKQEKFIFYNKGELRSKLSVGVGGSIDVFAGKVNRAPEIFIKYNIEWFYRLAMQPTRIKRILQIPLFILEIIFDK